MGSKFGVICQMERQEFLLNMLTLLPLGGQMTHTREMYTYGHHIYIDGYRYRGRPVGHWADTDSQIISFGGFTSI